MLFVSFCYWAPRWCEAGLLYIQLRSVWWVAVHHHMQYITCAIKWEILVYYIDEVAACRLWGKHVIEIVVEFLFANTVTIPKDVIFFVCERECIEFDIFVCARLNSAPVSSVKSVAVSLYRRNVGPKCILLTNFRNISLKFIFFCLDVKWNKKELNQERLVMIYILKDIPVFFDLKRDCDKKCNFLHNEKVFSKLKS